MENDFKRVERKPTEWETVVEKAGKELENSQEETMKKLADAIAVRKDHELRRGSCANKEEIWNYIKG